MSHFAVLVATKTPEELDEVLQPYHEFECTGCDDQYVVDVDQTEEARQTYEEGTKRRLKSPDGTLHNPYDDKFYRDPTPEEKERIGPIAGTGCGRGMSWTSRDWKDGLGYRTKINFSPEGYEEIEVPLKDVKTLVEHIDGYYGKPVVEHGKEPDLKGTHKYGYVTVDADGNVIKVIDRTNPNKQWDWWVIGGRYAGRLLTKSGMIADQCRKSNLDLEGMRTNAIAKRRSSWAESLAKAEEAGLSLTEDELDQKRREFYRKKEAEIEAWQIAKTDRRQHYTDFMQEWERYDAVFTDWGPITTDRDIPIAEWINAAPALSSFAVLKDGTWYEKGSMGWWGVVHDEKDEAVWEEQLNKMIAELPDDAWITIVDCHI